MQIVNGDKSHIDEVFKIESEEIIVPWSKNQIENLVENKDCVFRVLVGDNNKVLGYYSFNIICDEAYINNIAVIKDMQSKGLGTLLFQDLIDSCKSKNINAITLEVEKENIKAIGLYKKFNFTEEGIRKKYYKNTFDAIIMWLRDIEK